MRSALTVARVTSLLGIFLAAAVLMGIIAAGLLVPVVGAAGYAAREGVGMFERLPGDLESNPLAQQSRILAADGTVLATPARQNRIIVDSEDISPHMKNAQVAIEDERFYDHGGMDIEALARAVVSNATTDSTQGGSTLTQQYIKLALSEEALRNRDAEAWQAAQVRSGMDGYIRKLRELKYAITLEERLTKDEILTGYLNLSFYGDNTYGVEAAAQHYFNVNAKDLSIAQAALLAGVVRSPSNTNPVANIELATLRRNLVLDKMLNLDMITEEEHQEARNSEVELQLTDSARTCLKSPNPYFCEYVEDWVLQQPALGVTRDEREERLYTGGYTIETTLNLEISEILAEATLDWTPRGNDYLLGSAVAVIEPGTGHVLAFNQSSEFSYEDSGNKVDATSVNWSAESTGGGGGMSVGSVAKAFTVVEALKKGIPVEATISMRAPGLADQEGNWLNDPENPTPRNQWPPASQVHPVGVFFHDDFQDGCSIGADYWTIRNAVDQHHEREITLREATAYSVNTAFAQLASQVGTCDIRDTMADMGLREPSGEQYGEWAPDFVLGSADATPLTIANSYATMASGGIYCEPTPVVRITDSEGNELELDQPECERVLDEDVALGTVDLLKGVISPVGSGWQSILEDERPSAGKTGTNNNSTHTWFAGFTPQLSVSVFVGNIPGAAQYGGELANLRLGDRYVDGPLFGSSLAAPMWKEIMDDINDALDLPIEDWDEPSDEVLNGKRATIPSVVGMTEEEALEALEDEGISATVARVASGQPEGTVLYTTPGQGSSIRTSDPVTLHVSTGVAPPAPRPSRPAPAPQPPRGGDNSDRGGRGGGDSGGSDDGDRGGGNSGGGSDDGDTGGGNSGGGGDDGGGDDGGGDDGSSDVPVTPEPSPAPSPDPPDEDE